MENPALTNAAWWYWFWELVGTISFFGVIVTLAVEFGAARLGAPYKAILDNAREERLSAANERAANAELELAKFRAPRKIANEDAFVKALEAAPTPVSLRVRYVDEPDSSALATQLFLVLALKLHWKISAPPIPLAPISQADAIYPPSWGMMPATVAVGAPFGRGITITANKVDPAAGTPTLDALQAALEAQVGGFVGRTDNATLPDGVIVVIVAPKE